MWCCQSFLLNKVHALTAHAVRLTEEVEAKVQQLEASAKVPNGFWGTASQLTESMERRLKECEVREQRVLSAVQVNWRHVAHVVLGRRCRSSCETSCTAGTRLQRQRPLPMQRRANFTAPKTRRSARATRLRSGQR